MSMKEQYYFRDVDSTFTEPLQEIIDDAKIDGLTEVTVLEAVPDNETTGYIWCTLSGACVEQSECRKSQCSDYTSKSGRGRCQNKGNLYLHGEEKTFKIES